MNIFTIYYNIGITCIFFIMILKYLKLLNKKYLVSNYGELKNMDCVFTTLKDGVFVYFLMCLLKVFFATFTVNYLFLIWLMEYLCCGRYTWLYVKKANAQNNI